MYSKSLTVALLYTSGPDAHSSFVYALDLHSSLTALTAHYPASHTLLYTRIPLFTAVPTLRTFRLRRPC